MDLNATITIQSIITVSLAVITIFQFILSNRRNDKTDERERTKQDTKVNYKLDELCRGSAEISSTMKAINLNINEMNEKIIRLEDRVSTIEKEIEKEK